MIDVFAAPRRIPIQRRSEQTVQRILDAAESLLCKIPLIFQPLSNPLAMLHRQSIEDGLLVAEKAIQSADRHAGFPGDSARERMRMRDNPELELRMRVLTEAGERLIWFAYEQKTSEARDLVLQEMKRMLTGYLFVRG